MPIIKHITITSCHCYGYGYQFCDWWIQLSYSMSLMSLAYLSVQNEAVYEPITFEEIVRVMITD